MALTWYLCDLKSGDRITDLPLAANGAVEKTIGQSSTLGVTLAVHSDACPEDWATLIDPMRAMFVLDDDGHAVQAYYIDADSMGEPSASFTLISLEGAANETYCRTHDFFEGEHDESQVIATLAADVLVPSFGFEVDVTPCGKSGDHSYAFEEDRAVGDAISELSKAQGGPEWTVRLRWEDATRRRIIKTLVVGPKVGTVIESVVIENIHLAGNRVRRGSYSRGNRATHVIATGDGSGAGRMMSAVHVDADALDAGVPQWEVRLSTTGVETEAQLDDIGFAGLVRRRRGVRTWEMRLNLSTSAPRPGRDFNAGDTVTIDSGPTGNDPTSWRGLARVIGWRGDVEGDDFRTATVVFYEEPERYVS